jgi:uncharacterized membrane protein YebE (DUF533 family)
MIGNAKQLLDNLMGSGLAGGFAGGLAGGALTGLIASKKGRKLAGTALQVGGLALVGGLAYKAYQSYRQGQRGEANGTGAQTTYDSVSLPYGNAFVPPRDDVAAQQALGMLLLRAMIAAAKADGHIDGDESSRIFSEINRLGLGPQEKALLFEEYSRPLDLDALVAAVDSPAHAAEVYAASLLAVELDTPAERQYLADLAQRLGLEPALVDALHAELANDAGAQTIAKPGVSVRYGTRP